MELSDEMNSRKGKARCAFTGACMTAFCLTAAYILLTYFTAITLIDIARSFLQQGIAFPESRFWAPAAAFILYRVSDRGRYIPDLFTEKVWHIPRDSSYRNGFRYLRRIMTWVSRLYSAVLSLLILGSALLLIFLYIRSRLNR